MYNWSDCDRKCQLSLILTEPLNPREGTVNVFFKSTFGNLNTRKYEKEKAKIFLIYHRTSIKQNRKILANSFVFFTVEDHWLISDLELKYNYVDRPIKLAGYIYYWCSTICTGRIDLLLVQYYMYWRDIFTTGAVLYVLAGYVYYWCSTMYWQDIFTTGSVLYELPGYIYYW